MERRMWGNEHPRVSTALFKLGGSYVEQGRIAEAESLYWEGLAIRTAFCGEGTSPHAEALHEVGHFLWRKGNMAKAEEYHRKAIAIWRKTIGPTWMLGIGLNDLAVVLGAQGKDEESLETLLEARQVLAEYRGEDHQDVALADNNIGTFLLNRGRYAEADPHIRSALATWTKLEHPSVAVGLGNLGYALHSMDRLEEAETQYRLALAEHQSRRPSGPWGLSRLICATNLGVCLHHEGKRQEAEDVLLAAQSKFRESVGENRPEYGYLLANLGSVLVDAGKLREARRALARSPDVLGNSAVQKKWIPWVRVALAVCAAREGRSTEADSLLRLGTPEAWTNMELLPSARRVARDRAIRVYESIGRGEKAAEIRTSAIPDRETGIRQRVAPDG
jgi:tetratricopeptide (TPR) repeat protein